MSENHTRCIGEDRVWSEFFDWVTGGDGYLYESRPWSHDRIHVTLDEERTREDGDVKKSACEVFWPSRIGIPKLKQQSCIRVVHRRRNSWN